jgi:hypothetical protein
VVLENGGLWRIFGHKGDEVTGDWKRLHNGALYDLCSPNMRVLISSRKKLTCGTYRGEGWKCAVLAGKPEGRNHIVDIDLDGTIILKWILKK